VAPSFPRKLTSFGKSERGATGGFHNVVAGTISGALDLEARQVGNFPICAEILLGRKNIAAIGKWISSGGNAGFIRAPER